MSVTPIIRQRKWYFPPIKGLSWRPQWRWTSFFLWATGLAVAGLVLLPALYLTIRTAESGQAALEILLKPQTFATLGRTTLLAFSVTMASALIAVPMAWLTTCTDLPARRFWSVVTALPLVLPSYVGAYLFVSLLGPKGVLQQWLGVERLPTIYGFPGAFLVLTFMSYPYVLLTTRAALKRMDPSLVEAALSLGLSPRRAFLKVTLPQLRPAVVAGSLLVALYVLRDFGAVATMRYDTFTRIIYVQYQSFLSRGLAAALALLLIAMTAVILYFERKTRTNAVYMRVSAGAPRQPKPVHLGMWRWVALAFLSGVVGFALILPAFGLFYWVIRGLARGEVLHSLWMPAFSSFTASTAAALLTIFLGIPVAVLAVRRSNRLSVWIEQVTYAGFALPGIVVALALVFFGANYMPSLYQTLPLLIMAYVVLFVPQAVGSIKTSLLQVPTYLEEAGRSLGQSSSQVFRKITLPLVRPGLLAGGALVFLTCMKELPATLLLSPLGFKTLSVSVWGAISEAFFAQAAMPALLLILLSSIPLALLTLRDA